MRELRNIAPRVKAVVASGYPSDPAMSQFGDFGFRAAFSKPYTVKN